MLVKSCVCRSYRRPRPPPRPLLPTHEASHHPAPSGAQAPVEQAADGLLAPDLAAHGEGHQGHAVKAGQRQEGGAEGGESCRAQSGARTASPRSPRTSTSAAPLVRQGTFTQAKAKAEKSSKKYKPKDKRIWLGGGKKAAAP